MVNQGLLLVNFVGFLFLNLLTGGELNIEQDIPGTMNPGEEVLVTVTIDKGELNGFAKLQLNAPSGVSITAVERKGASFTFNDQKAKFIWMALPAEAKFEITYYLNISAIATGDKDIVGTFSYIEENQRKTYELPLYSIDLGEGNLTALDDEDILMNEPELPALNGEAAAATATAPAFSLPLAEAIQGPGGINGDRVITHVADNEYLVSVTVNKKGIRGFGKLQETIPPGFSALEKESDDAIFTTQGEIVKFVWLNLPPKEELKVEYRLFANSTAPADYKIDGQFGYLLNDETQKTTLASTPFRAGEAVLVQNTPTESDPAITAEPIESPEPVVAQKPEPAASPEPIVNPEPQQVVVPEPVQIDDPVVADKPSVEKEPVSNIPSAENGVTYKVQITAGHKDVGREYFITRHKYHGDFGVERHQGWIKYLTGKYGAYGDAKARRNALVSAGHNFPGPFVTAYNDGQRITVQEALMISNQKWVQ